MSIKPLGETMTEQPHTDTEKLAHRIAWRYKQNDGPAQSAIYSFDRNTLLQFADFLIAAERERCAKVCEDFDDEGGAGEAWAHRFAGAVRNAPNVQGNRPDTATET